MIYFIIYLLGVIFSCLFWWSSFQMTDFGEAFARSLIWPIALPIVLGDLYRRIWNRVQFDE